MAELVSIAESLGLQFGHDDPLSIPSNYFQFQLIQTGNMNYPADKRPRLDNAPSSVRRVHNVTFGTVRGISIKAFDFCYSTGHGKGSVSKETSAVIVDMDMIFPSPILIRQESVADRAASAMEFNDVDFDSEEFSKRFYVSCKNKKLAYDVIHPKMMHFLLMHPAMYIELYGRSILVTNNKVMSAAETRSTIDFVLQFVDLIPDYLKKQMSSPKRTPPSAFL